MKKETEGLLTAAQNKALRTNCIKKKIDKPDVLPLCHLCGEREDVSHITAECKKLAQISLKTGDTTRLLKLSTGIFAKRFICSAAKPGMTILHR